MLKIFPSVLGCYLVLICFYWSFWVFLIKLFFQKMIRLERSFFWNFVLCLFCLSFEGYLRKKNLTGFRYCFGLDLRQLNFLFFFCWRNLRSIPSFLFNVSWIACRSSCWSFLFNSDSAADISDDTFAAVLSQKTITSSIFSRIICVTQILLFCLVKNLIEKLTFLLFYLANLSAVLKKVFK